MKDLIPKRAKDNAREFPSHGREDRSDGDSLFCMSAGKTAGIAGMCVKETKSKGIS